MSEPELTKAELHYFDPYRVIEFGIPSRCANCYEITHDIALQDLSEALQIEPEPGSTQEAELIHQRRELKVRLVAKAVGCTGCEKLGPEEIDTWVNEHYQEAGLDDDTRVVGYRCPTSGEKHMAISYPDGHVSLRSSGLVYEDYYGVNTLPAADRPAPGSLHPSQGTDKTIDLSL